MANENQQDPITLNITENRHDNMVFTSSLQDMQINPQGSRGEVMSRKPTIEDIFGSPDIGRLLKEQKYHEAYVISRRRLQFDPAAIRPKDLANHYRCCMLVGEANEAIRIKKQLTKSLKQKSQITPNEIKTFADTIRDEEREMEAILFDQIAAEFYRNQSLAGLDGIQNCVLGIQESIEAMLSRDEELKPVVLTHVIPLMRDMREMIQRSDDVSEEDRSLKEVWCLSHIGYSEYFVEDLDGSEKTLEEAIDIMERVFKERAGKYQLYGYCLNILGIKYERTSQPQNACRYYRKAIKAFGKAEDINDDLRDERIAMSMRNLERAESPMK
ncbi:uncharacterized protein LOC144749822 [Ciona intestinalis]